MMEKDEKIEELKDHINYLENVYWNKMINPPVERQRRHIELLEEGVDVEDIHEGLLVNNKFVVATKTNKWRVYGKNKWYRFKDIPSFVQNYVTQG